MGLSKIFSLICLTFFLQAVDLMGQDRTINPCVNGGVYDITLGEDVECVFGATGFSKLRIWRLSGGDNVSVYDGGSWASVGNDKNKYRENTSSNKVRIKIDKVGDYQIRFRFRDPVQDFNITFKVKSPTSTPSPALSAIVKNSDCSGKSGSIDLSIQNLDTYITFDGTSTVSIGGFSYVSKRDFTIEGRIRVDEDDSSFDSRSFISLFGQDNTVEFGFINGRLAFYVATIGGGNYTFKNGGEYPNDGKWHHVAVRGNGEMIEVLIDGVVVGTHSITYSELKVDSGGAKNILIGDGVWGQSNEAFKGDISRLAFWGKYLDTSDFLDLDLVNAEWISGDAEGLVTAYNIDKKDGNKLIAVTPDGSTDCTGQLSHPDKQWEFWVNSYSWTGPSGFSSSTDQDIYNLAPGEYTVTVNYSHDGSNRNLTESFNVVLDDNLSVEIISDNKSVCEGEELNLSTNISGGVNAETIYTWEIIDGGVTKMIIGTDKVFVAPIDFLGVKNIRLRVNTGICGEKVSSLKRIKINKRIKTKTISHRRK